MVIGSAGCGKSTSWSTLPHFDVNAIIGNSSMSTTDADILETSMLSCFDMYYNILLNEFTP
jgi:hypothetical protein